jgi:hypothetical protein
MTEFEEMPPIDDESNTNDSVDLDTCSVGGSDAEIMTGSDVPSDDSDDSYGFVG